MKNNEKRIIIILMLILILLIVIRFVFIGNKNYNNQIDNNNNNNNDNNTNEEYSKMLSDGKKLNKSTKIQETKTIDGLEISNVQLTEKDNISVLLGTITNKTSEKKGDYPVDIIIYDKQENEIITIGGYIGELEPGESTQLNSSATFDYANAYDFKIEKIKQQ